MSDTDSFINEVTEEVRRDRLFALMRKYGWIAILAVILIVAGASWREYTKAQHRAKAESLGDAMLAALKSDDPAAQAAALAGIQPEDAGGKAVLEMLRAASLSESGDIPAAIAALDAMAVDPDLRPIYRQIAAFKSLLLQTADADADVADLRIGFEALAKPGDPLRLLAEEQLALIDLREGDRAGAVDRLQAILEDAELTDDVRQRVVSLLVSLGVTPGPADGSDNGSNDPVSDG
ncbi:MAG: hypothetical protein ACWA5A_04575 [Marinibacterium sp.]